MSIFSDDLKDLRKQLKRQFVLENNKYFSNKCCSCDQMNNCSILSNGTGDNAGWFNCFVRRFFHLMGIRWGTFSLITPQGVIHYNYAGIGQQAWHKEDEFYKHFDNPSKFGISRFLFEENGQKFVSQFSLDSVFRIDVIGGEEPKVVVSGDSGKEATFEVDSRDGYGEYISLMKKWAGLHNGGNEGFRMYFVTLGLEPLRQGYNVNGVYIVESNEAQHEEDWLNEGSLIQVQASLSFVFSDVLQVRYHRLVQELNNELLRHALRSAIAAIMSRNMSHNIGSHVLARIVTGGIDGWTQGLGVEAIVEKLCGNECRSYARPLVYWSKDIQILARYLQQRMDFIAQVSTEWPTWSEPTWFMQDLMRWFLSQKHLLNYIAYSDGLEAHLYQQSSPTQDTCACTDQGQTQQSEPKRVSENDNSSEVGEASQEQAKQIPNSSNDTSEEKRGDIRLHVFLVPEDCWNEPCRNGKDMVRARRDQIQNGCTKGAAQLPCRRSRDPKQQPCEQCHRILLYTGKDTLECLLDEDFQVAIPGGVVGQHAFFTILENIIRNAAKHGYSQQTGEANNQSSKLQDHLDVVIEMLYDPEENVAIQNKVNGQTKRVPAYLFRIYTNVSPVTTEDGKIVVRDNVDINDILGKSIIKETGEVERANWGHAEMKIAAGYLQLRDIMHIGGRGQEITGDLNISMLDLGKIGEGSRAIIRAVQSPIGTLGYEFYIPRPRTVGIVCP